MWGTTQWLPTPSHTDSCVVCLWLLVVLFTRAAGNRGSQHQAPVWFACPAPALIFDRERSRGQINHCSDHTWSPTDQTRALKGDIDHTLPLVNMTGWQQVQVPRLSMLLLRVLSLRPVETLALYA